MVTDAGTQTHIFTAQGMFNNKKTSVLLDGSVKRCEADTAMVTIDGSRADGVSIVGNAKSNVIIGSSGADTLYGLYGNNTLTGGGGNDVFVWQVGGNDVVKDYVSGEDKVSILAETHEDVVNGDIYIYFNNLSLKLEGDTIPADGKKVTFVNANGEYTKTYFNEKIVDNGGVTLLSSYSDASYTGSEPTIDASALKKGVTLSGSGTVTGSKGADVISGSVMIGGAGADTFLAGNGSATIGDYGTGKDKISLQSAWTDANVVGNNVIIGFGNSSSLTLTNAVGKEITFIETDGSTSVNVFRKEGIFNKAQTAVTVSASETTFNAYAFPKVESIDGSQMTATQSYLLGNAKANVIIAGSSPSYINGGPGNDTVWGFTAEDSLVVAGDKISSEKSGNDLLINVDEGSVLLIDFFAGTKGTGKGSSGSPTTTPNIVGVDDNGDTVPVSVETVPDPLVVDKFTERDDKYINRVDDATLEALAGDDDVVNYGKNVLLDGMKGSDTLVNEGENSTILGGEGDDLIENSAPNVTITGGKDNDSINLSPDADKNVIKYVTGDGHDTVTGFTPEDSLVAFGNDIQQTVTPDGDISVKVDDGSILLVGAASIKNPNIVPAKPEDEDSFEIDTTPPAPVTNDADSVPVDASDGSPVENEGDYVTITGSDDVDNQVDNSGSNAEINVGDGDDSVKNTGDKSEIDVGDGENTVDNRGKEVTITGGDDPDSVKNTGDKSEIDVGDGDNTVDNRGKEVTITGGDGDDSVKNTGDKSEIDVGDGDNTVQNSGKEVTITGGDGDDSVNNSGDKASIDVGDGENTVNNSGNFVTITGGVGDDLIDNTGSSVGFEYENGSGDDTVRGLGKGDTVTITGSPYESVETDDGVLLEVDDGSILLEGTTPDDMPAIVNDDTAPSNAKDTTLDEPAKVENSKDNASISGSDGSDTIDNSGNRVTITGGAGDDDIDNEGNNGSIDGGSGDDSIVNTGKSVTITGGADDDTIDNSGNNGSVDGGSGDDSIANSGKSVTITGSDGDDTIENSGSNSSIDGGNGNDHITNSGKSVTITGSDGDDTVVNSGDNSQVDGGNGNDSIVNSANSVTITGGNGDDQISLAPDSSDNVIVYEKGDGNDTIYGIDESDTLSVAGAVDSVETVGSDVVVALGDDSVTLKDAADLDLNIESVAQNVLTPHDDIYVNSASDVTLDALSGDDLLTIGGDNVSIAGNKGNDSITVNGDNVSVNAGKGDDLIVNNASSFILQYRTGDGHDTVTGWTHSSSIVAFGCDFKRETVGSDIVISVDDGSVTLKDAAGIKTALNFDSLPASADKLISLTDGDDSYENSDNNAVIEALAGNDSIVNFADDVYLDAGAGDDTVENDADNVTINAGTGDDFISLTTGLVAPFQRGNTSPATKIVGAQIFNAFSGGHIMCKRLNTYHWRRLAAATQTIRDRIYATQCALFAGRI